MSRTTPRSVTTWWSRTWCASPASPGHRCAASRARRPFMKPVGCGVWGVGTWGEKRARVYRAIDEALLVGVHGLQPGRAAEVGARYGCRAFDTPEELLEACEAVSIAVPTVAHREAVERGARARRHMLVEKPMAVTVDEADAMIEA